MNEQEARRSKLDSAFAAFHSRDWPQAGAVFASILEEPEPPGGEVLMALAICRFKLGSLSEASSFLERAFTAYRDNGNPRAAVMCAAQLVCLYEMLGADAAMRGWEQRGLRLIEDLGPCLERGYIALSRTGCEILDPKELDERAELALGLAMQFGDRDLELRARAEKGLALVSQGSVNAGFALLDEVMVAIVAGELRDEDMRGRSICSVLSACERTGDMARAEYWCRRIEEEPYLQHVVLVSHCRVVYGLVEALRGQWERAEGHLTYAMQAETSGFGHRAASAAKLAEIRLQQGKHDEAADLLRGFEDRFEAVPVLARLRLGEGHPEEAAALLRSAARGLGQDALRLAPLLSLEIEVDLIANDLPGARRALQRLLALDSQCESNEIRAYRRLGAGRIARHQAELDAATEELETALVLLTHYDRPLLTAHIRLELARALASREAASARVEAEAALATFLRVGIVPEATAARALLLSLEASEFGPRSAPPAHASPSHAPKAATSLTSREREVASLVALGLTNREIAERLVLSVRTVEGHIDRVLGKLDFHTRTQLALWVGGTHADFRG